jgi:hypothetical protein
LANKRRKGKGAGGFLAARQAACRRMSGQQGDCAKKLARL